MTYLRSIRLRGFKTFARSTEMLFEPGVTVVIGPNGSGKSNITDAVLWVLGEQSPTQLRGRNMQDVIFAGSGGRRRAPFAEVALVLDNSRGNLPTEFTEVEVVRRLQRDGSSEYRLNGAACRLLDVQELLSSAGLGREMHSVVGQGQVDAVLNSTPAERRSLVRKRRDWAATRNDGRGHSQNWRKSGATWGACWTWRAKSGKICDRSRLRPTPLTSMRS